MRSSRRSAKLSLPVKASALVLVIVMIALAFSAGVTVIQSNQLIAARQRHALDIIASTLANACELPMAVGDLPELHRRARETLGGDDELLFVAVFDRQRRLITVAANDIQAWERYVNQATAAGYSERSTQNAELPPWRPIPGMTVSSRWIEHIRKAADFSLFEGEEGGAASGSGSSWGARRARDGGGRQGDRRTEAIGSVVVGQSVVTIAAAQRSQALFTIVIAIALTLLIVPVVFLTVGAWTRRLSKLVEASESISRGDFSGSTEDARDDELGALSRAFEAMRRTVQQRDQTLRGFNATLQDQVAEATEELKRALVEAEAANQAKSQFLANMSHEIRTPMTAILGYAEMMVDPTQGASDRLECVQVIGRNAGHLLSIINDILDISKIEAGKMKVERIECSPAQVIADVASLMRGRAIERGLRYTIEYDGPVPEIIHTDPTRLKQILMNLSGNAIKFTEAGEVRLTAQLLDPEMGACSNARMRFIVTDTGVGMTAGQIRELFTPFTQADSSTTRRFGGTGLGLTISKRLAHLLGGDIRVESMPGQGSTFTLEIEIGSIDGVRLIDGADEVECAAPPADTACNDHADRAAGAESPAPSLEGLRILLAEDGIDNQRLITFILEKVGAEVDIAENGRIACAMATERGPGYDLVLMDMQMPQMDGYTAASKLRMRGYDRPIIALTAHAMAGDRERCLTAGCDDYATKPIDRAAMLAMIHQWAGRRHTPANAAAPSDVG